jgi:UDP-N-acetylmuramate dehydrogenase
MKCMKILKDYNLSALNAFKINVLTKYFIEINSEKEILKIFKNPDLNKLKLFIIGNGYNTLFRNDFEGMVIKINIMGIKLINENDKFVILEIGAGEDWHNLVMNSVNQGWSGIENLAYIPGTVGAAPVQNIAAYGQNFGDVAVSVNGFNLTCYKFETIEAKDCNFFYRDSVFKNKLKNKFIVTSVRLKLYKTPHFDLNYFGSKPYESLQSEIKKIVPEFPNVQITPKIVAQAVINQRTIKMPDWKVVGTAGSYFKNPFINKSKFDSLKKIIPDLQEYPIDKMLYPNPDDPIFKMSNKVKIPAGKLLDILGWRGKKDGNVGTFEKHALIVVCDMGVNSKDIINFTEKMKSDVFKNFEVKLEEEVNII